MSRYLIDTNHLSPLVTLDHPLRSRITEQLDKGDEISIPTVVLTEFLFGIQIIPRAAANMREWERLQNRFGYYSVSRKNSEDAADIQLSMRLRGRQVATIDALIAAIAIRNKLILLTTDRDFEFIPDLEYENWITT